MSAHELDHLAIAVPEWTSAGTVLHAELGARWASGFTTADFNPCQLTLADDMRVELLEPNGAPHSFVRRFLDEHDGAAPHHITFKVRDIHAAITGARDAGIEPILVNLDHPAWQEAFLHPRDTGLGFLAQIVQTSGQVEDLAATLPNATGGCPWNEAAGSPQRLQAIHGGVQQLHRARCVLVEVLGATEFTPGEPGDEVEAEGPGDGATLGFRWDAGADLLLTPTTNRAGIDAIGILPAAESWQPEHYPQDLADRWATGAWHPELGLRIAGLQAAELPNRTLHKAT